MNKKKRVVLFLNFLLCISFLLSGCGKSKNALMDYRVSAPKNQSGVWNGSADTQDFLSKGMCVVSKKEADTTKKASIMSSKASLMINDTDSKLLYSNNIYKKIYPASITKIVTAYVTLKYANLNDIVTISYNASHITEYGAKLCGFAQGDKITLKNLLYSFLICSGNDAGVAIAEHVGGSVSNFAKMMNREMYNIGATNSHFVNPHGLHNSNHYTTAYDLYLVFHRLIQNPVFVDIINHGYYTAVFKGKNNKTKKLYFHSTDRYLVHRAKAPKGVEVIGGKTGTTFKAGSCLILYSKGKNKKNFISVVLKAEGASDLYSQMNYLLSYANK